MVQGSLLEPEDARDSLFFAILPDADLQIRLAERAAELKRAGALAGSLRPAALLHVSLHAVIDLSVGLPPDRVREALKAGDATAWPAPFEMVFDTAMRFGGDAVVFTGRDNPGFGTLHGALGASMRKLGFKAKASAQPHVSVMYDGAPFDPRPIAPLRWPVREVTLVHSHVGQSRYDALERWRLR